ncbi:MAG: BtpA/SgcQ family protein [Planctomycetes bacterium]|nr:BtpA/SgcQ family protein [Planctomycetota bacterium]
MSLLPEWAGIKVPVIGMLHCPPLPGSHACRGDLDEILRFVLQDAQSLRDGGVNGLMLENFGDTPFHPDRVPAITVAAMTALACAVRQRVPLPLGINVLRNDGRSALAVAAASGASFIRVNVLCGARVTDQGLIQGIAHDLLCERANLGCSGIRILADVDVKHSAPLATRPLDIETRDLVERAHADAVIVSGHATGTATDLESLSIVSQAAGAVPVFVGSGVNNENVASLMQSGARGLIVGSSLKCDGKLFNPVDTKRVGCLMNAVAAACSTSCQTEDRPPQRRQQS